MMTPDEYGNTAGITVNAALGSFLVVVAVDLLVAYSLSINDFRILGAMALLSAVLVFQITPALATYWADHSVDDPIAFR